MAMRHFFENSSFSCFLPNLLNPLLFFILFGFLGYSFLEKCCIANQILKS